jgi:Stress responsive A/B Barrel Domain
MIEHCVFCEIRPDAAAEALDSVFERLGSLLAVVDGMTDFRSGPNRDFENKSGRYNFGFICTFRDREAHLAYERHPVHAAAGGDLVGLCAGGYDGIMVYDLET